MVLTQLSDGELWFKWKKIVSKMSNIQTEKLKLSVIIVINTGIIRASTIKSVVENVFYW